MTTSEDVLQSISYVRHKKTDGTLYVMPSRLGWMPNGKDSITSSIKFDDVKMQKISPEGKPKIQLQLLLHTNEAPTFHFVHPDGAAAQLRSRNEVKELLQQLLPKFKKRITKDLEEKNRILMEYPELYQLYKVLVVGQVIGAEDFWTQIVPPRLAGLRSATGRLGQQSVGISPAFLSSVRPISDGINGLNYSISNDIIEAIFRTYPAVKRKHFENVPHKISESDFWARFFQSHYFHRDRVVGSGKSDIFADCARQDEQRHKAAVNQGVDDPFMDLTSFDDVEYVRRPDDGQTEKSTASESTSGKKDRDRFETTSTMTTNNQALIKRFNHHSIMVLDACLASKESSTTGSPASSVKSAAIGSINGSLKAQHPPAVKVNGKSKKSPPSLNSPSPSSSSHYSIESTDEADDARRRRKRLAAEHTTLEDLNGILTADPNSWVSLGAKQLRIQDKELYMAGPTTSTNPHACDTNGVPGYGLVRGQQRPMTLADTATSQELRLSQWLPSPSQSLTSNNALLALRDLSPGGTLFPDQHRGELKDSIPQELQKELRSTYLACNELLRQFWACFPECYTNDKQEEKLIQMKATLQKFNYVKLEPLQSKIKKEHYNADLTNHLRIQIEKAMRRFTIWESKKERLRRK